MELHKGICFLCNKTKIIKLSESLETSEIILHLFKDFLNHAEFNKVQSALKLCPICYHKLILLKRTRENIKSDISKEATVSSCFLCESEINLFHVNNWPGFNAMVDGTAFLKNNKCVTCSECLFYLETKTEIKTKLLSKYPQLRVKTPMKDKKIMWKVKLAPKSKQRATLPKNERLSRKRKFAETINISSSDDEPLITKSLKSIKLDSVKKLIPLKDHISYRDQKVVKIDPKFLNQIPYVLINLSNFSKLDNSTLDDSNTKKLSKSRLFKNTPEETTNYITDHIENLSVSKELEKLNVDLKQLVVNVSRMKIEKFLKKSENEQKYLEESENEHVENSDSFIETQDTSLAEASFEAKNKRKSVSFAEDKNVEIEYLENESSMLFTKINNTDEDNSEVTSTRQSKGILKREDNTTEIVDVSAKEIIESSKESIETEDQETNGNSSGGSNTAISEKNENEDSGSDSDKEKLFRNNRPELDSGEQENSLRNVSNISSSISIDDDIEDEKNNEQKNKENTNPIPTSRRKRRHTIVEDISDDDTPADSTPDDPDVINVSDTLEKTNSSENIVSEQTVEDDISSSIPETTGTENDLKSKGKNKKYKPKPLSKKKLLNTNFENISDDDVPSYPDDNHPGSNGVNLEQNNIVQNERLVEEESICNETDIIESENSITIKPSVEEEKLESKKGKREKSKPLSKKKKKKTNEETEPTSKNTYCESTYESNTEDIPKASTDDDSNLNKLSTDIDTENRVEAIDDNDINEHVNNHVEGTVEVAKEDSSLVEEISSALECEKSTVTDVITPQFSEEVLNRNEGDTNSNEIDKDLLVNTADSSKSYSVFDNDVVRLVEDISSQDSSSFVSTEDKDLAKEVNLGGEIKDFAELTEENTTDKKIESVDVTPFNLVVDKTDELGISEDDNDNINSILSHIFPDDLDEDRQEEQNERKNEDDVADNSHQDVKRKNSSDELNVSNEKKKKKVTFCDEVT